MSGVLRISLFSLYHFRTARLDRLRKKEKKKKTWEERPTNFSSKYLFFIFLSVSSKFPFFFFFFFVLKIRVCIYFLWVSIFLIFCYYGSFRFRYSKFDFFCLCRWHVLLLSLLVWFMEASSLRFSRYLLVYSFYLRSTS